MDVRFRRLWGKEKCGGNNICGMSRIVEEKTTASLPACSGWIPLAFLPGSSKALSDFGIHWPACYFVYSIYILFYPVL